MTKFLLAAILALGTTTMAFAAPVKMTDNQLDQVTAGADFEFSSSVTATGSGLVVGSITIDQNSHFKLTLP